MQLHLLHNVASLLSKGVQLEARHGSLRFGLLMAWLAALSQGLYVAGAAALAAYIPEYGLLYARTCAIGFSGVLFALKVVLTWRAPGWSTILGVSLPTKYLAW
jgi:rhomboid domain-containing protein 1